MNRAIGSVHAEMSAGHAKFEADLAKAKEAVRRNAAQMNTAMSKVGRSFSSTLGFAKKWGLYASGAGAAAIMALTRQAINNADQMGKTAQQIGLTTERLSTLAEVAGYSNVNLDQLTTAMRNISRGAVDTVNGTGRAAQAYEQLGIDVRDATGRVRDADDILMEVAEHFSVMADGAEKTRLAMRIFGEQAGPRMIPMLNQGADGIRNLEQRARDLGMEISTETARQAERFNDLLRELTRHSAGWGRELGVTVLPTLTKIAEAMNNAYIAGGSMASIWAGISAAFRREGIGYIERDLERVRRQIERIEEKGGLWQRGMLGGHKAEEQRLVEKLNAAYKESADEAIRAAHAELKRQAALAENQERIRKLQEATRERADEEARLQRIREQEDAEQQRIMTLGESRIEQLRRENDLFDATSRLKQLKWEIEHGALSELNEEHKQTLLLLAQEYDARQDLVDAERRDEEQKMRAAHLLDRAMTKQERLNRAIAELNELNDAGLIIGEEYYRVYQNILDTYSEISREGTDAMGDLNSEMQRFVNRSIDSLSRFAVYGSRSFKDFAQSVIQDLIRIQLQTQLTTIFSAWQMGGTPGISTTVENISTGSPVLPGLQRTIPPAPSARPAQDIRVVNVLDPSIVSDWAQSAQGERVVMNIMRKNATQLREVV